MLAELSGIRHKQMIEYDSKEYRKEGEKNKPANISFIIKLIQFSMLFLQFSNDSLYVVNVSNRNMTM